MKNLLLDHKFDECKEDVFLLLCYYVYHALNKIM